MRTTSATAATKYEHSQITHADPVQLIVLLYDGALSRIAQGRQRFQEKDLLHAGLAISKAQAIVGELRKSLNMEAGGEIAGNLNLLYAYLHELLVRAMLENRAEPLEEATTLLKELRGAWVEIAKITGAVLEKDQAAVNPAVEHTSGTPDATRVQVKA
jgi:flagellar protein FliS